MTEPIPAPLPDALADLVELLGAYGATFAITPKCDAERGYWLEAEPRPRNPRFIPITASSAAEMARLLDALEPR